jgi:SAM-dependent methyltransferase
LLIVLGWVPGVNGYAARVPGRDRLGEVVTTLAGILGRAAEQRGERLRVAVDGPDHDVFAGALRPALAGLPVDVVTSPADPPPDLRVAIRTAPVPGGSPPDDGDADVVVEWRDRTWPVLRDVAPGLPYGERERRRETQAFFGSRAPAWDARFGDDGPAYAAAVRDAGVPAGGVVADVGCGTGRALPGLRDAVGPGGTVLAIDVTREMLEVARERAAASRAALVLADAERLPLADASVDALLAAGLVGHLADPVAGLAELARVTRPGGVLAVFHPVGRAVLAARQGRTLRADDTLAEARLTGLLAASGWRATHYEDDAPRFLALAVRTGG